MKYSEENNLPKEKLRKSYELLEDQVLSRNLYVDIYIYLLNLKLKSINE